jgi:hypothetical protein
MIFLTQFSIKFSNSQTFLEKLLALFLEKYQALLPQSLPIVEFYHWLKYLQNFQSHPIHMS